MKCRAIAITGLIGSGKSVVGRYLSEQGYKVIDSDQIARLVSNDDMIIRQVALLLGEEYIVNGQLDRAKIRQIVFLNNDLLQRYTAIFSTAISNKIIQEINQYPVVFVEIPLMDAVDYNWYQVWNVVCNDDSRIDRASIRDNKSREHIIAISDNQQHFTKATHTIDNNGDMEYLYHQIDQLIANLGN